MKKFYTLFLVAVLAIPTVSATHTWRSNISLKKEAQKDVSAEWLPGSMEHYETYDAGATWELLDEYTYSYEGNLVKVEQTATARTTYTYDAHGNWIEKIVETGTEDANGNIVWTNSELHLREFDPIVPSFQTLKADYYWNERGNNWMMSYKHVKVVTRNANGNVESVIVRSYLPDESYLDLEGFKVIYDMNGKADAIIKYDIDYETWEMVSSYTYQDIEWEECGQIMSIDYMCLNDIRAKSYNISYDGTIVANVAITYNTDGLFSCTKTTTEPGYPDYSEVYQFTNIDEYGSYNESVTFTNGASSNGQRVYEKYDNWGNQVEYSYYELENGEWTIYDSILSYYTYEGGKLMEVMVEMTNPDTGKIEPSMKNIYSNHSQAGINDIEIDNNSAPVEFYNLQGVRVDGDLAPGIYIRRQGTNVQKVLK